MACFFVDSAMQLTLINPSAKKLLGLEDKNATTLADILPILAQTCDISSYIQAACAQGKTATEDKITIGTKTLKLHIAPVLENHDNTSHIIGATIILQDITLATSLANLKEDFTNGIVHELRSPLTAIKSGTNCATRRSKFKAI